MNIVHTDTSYISIRSNFEMCLNMLCIIVTKVINQIFVHTLVYPINRYKLIAVHNVKHPQKINSQEANNCPFFDI